jgi:hypothetical protein
VSVGVAFILTLLVANMAQAQPNLTVTPTVPIANQPFTFTLDVGTPNSFNLNKWTSFSVYEIIGSGPSPVSSCPAPWDNMDMTRMVNVTAPVNAQGIFVYVMPHGLPAGRYWVYFMQANGYFCWKLSIPSTMPVPEFSGTLIIFSLSFAVLYCIIERRRIKRNHSRDFSLQK